MFLLPFGFLFGVLCQLLGQAQRAPHHEIVVGLTTLDLFGGFSLLGTFTLLIRLSGRIYHWVDLLRRDFGSLDTRFLCLLLVVLGVTLFGLTPSTLEEWKKFVLIDIIKIKEFSPLFQGVLTDLNSSSISFGELMVDLVVIELKCKANFLPRTHFWGKDFVNLRNLMVKHLEMGVEHFHVQGILL